MVGWRTYVDQRFQDSANAVRAALAAADKAADKLERDTAAHFADVNELQQAMKDQAARYPVRDEMIAQMTALSNRLDEMRLTAANHLTKEAFDAFAERHDVIHRDYRDEMLGYPTKAEVRAQMDTITIGVASLNQKVADATTEQAIKAGGWVTKAEFEAYSERQETNRAAARRAAIGAWVAGGIALVGWAITVILFIVSRKTGG